MRTMARVNLVLAGALAAAGAVAWDQTAQRLHTVTTVIVPTTGSNSTGTEFVGGGSVVSTTVLVHPHMVIAALLCAAALVAAVAGIWGLHRQAT